MRPAREVTAVTYRLGCKRVLLATRRLAAAHLARWTQQQQAQAQAQAQQRRPQPPQGRSPPGVAAKAKAKAKAKEEATPSAESLVEDLPEVVPAPTEEETVAVGVSARGAQEEVAPRKEPQPRSRKKPKKKRKSDSAKRGGGSL